MTTQPDEIAGTATGLDTIALIIRKWLEWHKDRRDKAGLETSPDTAIMSLPTPFWPSHDQFENWIETQQKGATALRELAQERDRLQERVTELYNGQKNSFLSLKSDGETLARLVAERDEWKSRALGCGYVEM